nr:resolvase [bacterium]
MTQFVAYFRVSTTEQGDSGLGIEAQQEKVRALVGSRDGDVIAEFTEIESGRKADRPVLAQALEAARKAKAVLVVAKLDRLARDAELINRLSKAVANNGFPGLLFADLPDVDATNAAGRMILGVMAQVAQFEAERIGERTREALAAAKARGVKLGGRREAAVVAAQARRGEAVKRAEALRGVLAPMAAAGQSQRQMAAALNAAGHRTERGSEWSHKTVGRVLDRLELS